MPPFRDSDELPSNLLKPVMAGQIIVKKNFTISCENWGKEKYLPCFLALMQAAQILIRSKRNVIREMLSINTCPYKAIPLPLDKRDTRT